MQGRRPYVEPSESLLGCHVRRSFVTSLAVDMRRWLESGISIMPRTLASGGGFVVDEMAEIIQETPTAAGPVTC
jgi:hypothetical protein